MGISWYLAKPQRKGVSPPLTLRFCQVPTDSHSQSKFRLISTSLALKRPVIRTVSEVFTADALKSPVVPVTTLSPSGFRTGIIVTFTFFGTLSSFSSSQSMSSNDRRLVFQEYP